jgi:ribonuclease BN (tRNA processing enzyme)
MRLHVLGSSGGYPSTENPCTGFLLEREGTRLWMDAGNGTFSALQRLADFRHLDALFLSHGHPDHCADAFVLYVALRYHRGGELSLPVFGPPGVLESLAAFFGVPAAEFGKTLRYRAVDQGDEVEVGGLRLTFHRTEHPVHTLAVRVEGGEGTLAFSSDTGPGSDLAGFARGCDLLVCEATYQEGAMGGPVHLSARQAAEIAREAGAGRLALTHVWPDLDPRVSVEEARAAAGDLRVTWAGPGDTFEFSGNL